MERSHYCETHTYLAFCTISIKAMRVSIRTMSRAVPSTWVPSKQHSRATWEEAGLPYWVWKRWAQRTRVRLYLVRKLELWRINRAEMCLVEGWRTGGGEGRAGTRRDGGWGAKRRCQTEKKSYMERMNNGVGVKQQSWSKWEDGRDGRWSKWGDDEERGTPVALTLGLWLARQRQRWKTMEVGLCDWGWVISFPWSLGMSVYSHRAGLDPLTALNTIIGQGWRVSSSSPLTLTPSVSFFLHLSCTQTRERQHVCIHTNSVPTSTVRHSCAQTHANSLSLYSKSLPPGFPSCFEWCKQEVWYNVAMVTVSLP